MIQRADISVYDRNERLQLVVEVKSISGASARWAAQMRRNLLTHAILSPAPYFLLALRDVFYLWTHAASVPDDVMPDYTIAAAPILVPYLGQSNLSLSDLSETSLELLVATWLQDVVDSHFTAETAPSAWQWLFESKLYEAIQHGAVAVETAV